MVTPERLLAVADAVRHVVRAGVPGDLVECGVWRGGCAMTMAFILRELGVTDRAIWLYDTFTGMTDAGPEDVSLRGEAAGDVLARLAADDPRRACSLVDVRRHMAATKWPAERTRFVEGPVEQTLPAQAPDTIAVLRLDTDWYASTRHELEHLYPRLARGGVLIVDDYGHWQGSRRAVDEYFAAHGIDMLLARTDYTGRMGIKT
jgi:hypothetical protein